MVRSKTAILALPGNAALRAENEEIKVMRTIGIREVCLLAALLLPYKAMAQTACPVGVAAGSAQCGPSPTEHVQGGDSQSEPTVRYVPTGEWIKTWGAIAQSDSTGDVGVSVGKVSEREALEDALSHCSTGGADDCQKSITYRNQCAVLVGSTGKAGTRENFGIAQTGESVEIASLLALQKCRSKTSPDAGCSINYSDCSEPVFRKY